MKKMQIFEVKKNTIFTSNQNLFKGKQMYCSICLDQHNMKWEQSQSNYGIYLLPGSKIIITSLEKIVKAFEDIVQVDLIRQRWKEIKILQNVPSFAFA